MRWVLLVVVAASCGRLGFGDGTGSENNSDADSMGTADGRMVPANDIWAQPWSAPVLWVHSDISFNSSPSLTADSTELFYVSSRGDAFAENDIYTSTFDGTTWTEPILVAELAIDGVTDDVKVSPDGLEIFMTRDAVATGLDVWFSTRPFVGAAWAIPALVDDPSDDVGVNTTFDDYPLATYAEGLEAFFGSSRPGTLGSRDVWRTTRIARGAPWDNATRVVELSSDWSDDSPWISPEGTHATIMSNRRPNNTDSGNDSNIYFSYRAPGGSFDTPTQLLEINSDPELGIGQTWDEDFTSSADGTLCLFSSNRSGTGTGTLYIATR